MKISSILKEIRNNHNKTQQEFADSIGVSRGTISQIEGDRANPTIEILDKIIKTYNIDANVFFDSISSNETIKITKEAIENSNLSSQFVVRELRDKLHKLNKLYQRLVDIKMMSNKQISKDIESDLFEFIDDFADIKNQYFSDLSFTENNLNPYKVKAPINIYLLSESQLKEYLNKLYSNVDLFETMFFDYFKKFYNDYMKDWYIK